MDKPYQVMPGIEVLPSHFPIPGACLLSVNAFVIKAKEPVLVDTGHGHRPRSIYEGSQVGHRSSRFEVGVAHA